MTEAGFGRGQVADSASSKSARKLPSAIICCGSESASSPAIFAHEAVVGHDPSLTSLK
jgi:hypothetical protein